MLTITIRLSKNATFVAFGVGRSRYLIWSAYYGLFYFISVSVLCWLKYGMKENSLYEY